MTTVDCPFCDHPVELDPSDEALTCHDCMIRVELAVDRAPALVAAAA